MADGKEAAMVSLGRVKVEAGGGARRPARLVYAPSFSRIFFSSAGHPSALMTFLNDRR